MVAGDLWDSFLPPNFGPYYSERDQPLFGTMLRMGNFDREWRTPTHMWPGGWPYGMFWSKGMYFTEYNPDSSWNPATLGGTTNPAYHPEAGKCYAFVSYAPSVIGASDPNRNFGRETRWVDPAARLHAVYEAGWPTNAGIDVRVKIHQFTVPWNNFNDFITVEIALTNTGVLDMNADGVSDSLQGGRPGLNRIRALTLVAMGEIFGSYFLNRSAGRQSRLGAARAFGYVADEDTTGTPWDMMVAFPGETQEFADDMGMNSGNERFYTDVWNGWAWVAAKSGTAPSGNLSALPGKQTIFGTPAIGAGLERGWYASAGHGKGLNVNESGNRGNPRYIHTASMGTWYRDGGRWRDTLLLDLSPDTSFFATGVTGDPTTFVPKTSPGRPAGDRKMLPLFEVRPRDARWTRGFSAATSFDGDMFSGIGPFSLDPGETMTIVWTEAGGYRLTGVQNAIAAARWAFENGYRVPAPPPVPVMSVENTNNATLKVRWDDRAESDTGFTEYRIYRSTTSHKVEWLTGGMRGLEAYWRSPAPGPVPDTLLEPVNPSFKAFDFVAGRMGEAASWGPYQLVAVIPKSDLTSRRDMSASGMKYFWEDRSADPGYAYWYTVAARATRHADLGPSYGGWNPRVTSVIETGNVNRNGAEGLWQGIYPFADLSPLFPATPEGRGRVGAGIVFTSKVADPRELATGLVRVSVRPNPYKQKATWDSRTNPMDHRIMFLNLPAVATITVLDVSGQTMARLDFRAPDGQTGSMSWNLISKDGYELASGLYIYVVEYEGGRQHGYFSILR